MHRSFTAAALWITLSLPPTASARPAAVDALELARQCLARRDAPGAVAALEAALAGASGEDRAAALNLLREAYPAAARQAEADGRRDEAEAYRDNLAIIERSPLTRGERPKPKATPIPPPRPFDSTPNPPADEPPIPLPDLPPSEPVKEPAAVPSPTRPAEAEPVLPEGPKATALPADAEPPAPAPASPPSDPRPLPSVGAKGDTAPAGSLNPAPPVARVEVPVKPVAGPSPAAVPRAEVTLESADAAFVAKRYDEAGAAYSALDKGRRLPPDRRDHWAYCRAVEVVRRINARPTSQAEWASIDTEIETIRALSPTNWFAEYLRNRAAERNPGGRAVKTPRTSKVVVRGSSPEEPAAPKPQARPPARPATAPPPPSDPTRGSTVSWGREPVVTDNFQVIYPEGRRELADQVARGAEAARADGLKRWGDPNKGRLWSPRCEIVIFPGAKDFSRETGQPADSPGFSTMGTNEGKVTFRRVHLRADHPGAVKAVLPHEVTHVVLADLFPRQQIPRWADEGMAVLSEPASEQSLRAADLNEPLAAGRLFRVSDLTAMDYPDARHWALYYAQSVSLTRYLVEQGTPAQFVAFLQESQRTGFEPALKRVYQIGSYGDLHARWASYARANASAEMTASAAGGEKVGTPARR